MLVNDGTGRNLVQALNILSCGLCESIRFSKMNVVLKVVEGVLIRYDNGNYLETLSKSYVYSNYTRQWWYCE